MFAGKARSLPLAPGAGPAFLINNKQVCKGLKGAVVDLAHTKVVLML
jgi:hypothetical protein